MGMDFLKSETLVLAVVLVVVHRLVVCKGGDLFITGWLTDVPRREQECK